MEGQRNIEREALQAMLKYLPAGELRDRAEQALRDSQVVRDPFTYTTTFAALAAAANATNNINIQADSDFLILATTYHANVANAGQTVSTFTYPLATVLLTDSGSGRQFMDSDVSIPDMFGNGQFPFVWPQPKLMAARSTLVVKATNYDAAQAYNLRLNFHGVKLFRL